MERRHLHQALDDVGDCCIVPSGWLADTLMIAATPAQKQLGELSVNQGAAGQDKQVQWALLADPPSFPSFLTPKTFLLITLCSYTTLRKPANVNWPLSHEKFRAGLEREAEASVGC